MYGHTRHTTLAFPLVICEVDEIGAGNLYHKDPDIGASFYGNHVFCTPCAFCFALAVDTYPTLPIQVRGTFLYRLGGRSN